MKLSQLIFFYIFFYLTLHSYYSIVILNKQKIKLFYLSLKDLNDDIFKIK